MKIPTDHSRRIAVFAAGCVLGAIAIRVAATKVGALEQADASGFYGFLALARPSTTGPANAVVWTGDPVGYALLVTATLAYGLRTRGLGPALAAGVAILGANVTTQVLKHALEAPRALGVAPHSWPSGHMTAAMSVVLAAVLLSPGHRRGLVAVAGGVYAVAMGYSLPLLGSHYPSDVLGAVPVAAAWIGLAALALPASERPWPLAPAPPRPDLLPALGAIAIIGAAVVAAALAQPRVVVIYAADHPALLAWASLIGLAAVAAVTAGATRPRGAP